MAIILGGVLRELENKVFPWVFTHCEPIRSHHLRSCDSYASFSQVMQELPRWQGYQPNSRFFHPWRSGILIWRYVAKFISYLKALSNFGKQPYGLTLHPYCTGEGFKIRFKKVLPQVVTTPHRVRGFSSTPSEWFPFRGV